MNRDYTYFLNRIALLLNVGKSTAHYWIEMFKNIL